MIAPVLLAGLLLTQAPAAAQTPPATPAKAEAEQPPALSPELALRVENVTLRRALLESQVQATIAALKAQQDAIDAAVRAALPGYDGIDWQTGQPRKAAPATDVPAGKGHDGGE